VVLVLAERAAESQVDRENAGFVKRTLSKVVSRVVMFFPIAERVAFVGEGPVYAAIREV
jgi:hypothetical protein